MQIYDQTIQFPVSTMVQIIGGHPAAGPVITEGVTIDTIDDSHEPYYLCYIIGNPRAVYPYTDSRHRILSQSELAPHPNKNIVRFSRPLNALASNIITQDVK